MKCTTVLIWFILTFLSAIGQTEADRKEIVRLDSIFWHAYNDCDVSVMTSLITEDFEFYHDKGGLTSGREKMSSLIKNGLCGNADVRIRREFIDGSLELFPLNNYGAILRGQHRFYQKDGDRKEYLTETARFTHVWQFDQGQWKMSRVLSFDHQSPQPSPTSAPISLKATELAKFVGSYEAPNTGRVEISVSEHGLRIQAGGMDAEILPRSKLIFFHQEAPLNFEFVENEQGAITKMMVRERGEIVEEAMKN